MLKILGAVPARELASQTPLQGVTVHGSFSEMNLVDESGGNLVIPQRRGGDLGRRWPAIIPYLSASFLADMLERLAKAELKKQDAERKQGSVADLTALETRGSHGGRHVTYGGILGRGRRRRLKNVRDARVDGTHGGATVDRALSSQENLHIILAAPVGTEPRGVTQVERCPGGGGGDLEPMLSR